MKCVTLGIILLLGLGSAMGAEQPDLVAGKALVEQHCQACHHSEVYSRPDRIVHDLAGLRGRVRYCEISQNQQWTDSEIEDVVAYLNKAYYHF